MTRKSAVIPLALALAVIAFFWKLLTKQYTWMDQPDTAIQILPWLQFQAAQWNLGNWFPLWDPNVWGGQPLIGQLVPGSTYPLNWPLFLMPFGRDGRLQPVFMNIQFILSHIMAAIFCYWLCRDLGRSRVASALGGLAFSLTGMVGGWGWPQMLNNSIWMPLPVLFFRRSIVMAEHRLANVALAGAFMGVMFLGGHHQIPTLFALLMGGVWLVRVWKERLAAMVPAIVFGAMTLLVAGFQIIPALEYGVRSIRWVSAQNPVGWGQAVPYLVHQDYQHSFFPSGLLGLVLANLSENSTFVGLAVITLALAGLITGFRRYAEIPYIGAYCVAAMLYAFGGFSIFHGIAYLFVPMVEKARSPAMAICMAQFAIVILAVFGTDAILENAKALSKRWVYVLTALGAIAWIVVAIASSVRTQTSLEYEQPVIFGLMAFSLSALLWAWRTSAIDLRTVMTALLLLVFFEAGTVTGRNFHHREAPAGFLYNLSKNRDAIDYLKGQPGPVRVEYQVNETFHYNIGDWDGVPQFAAYLAGLTRNVAQLVAPDELKPVLPKIFALTHFAGKEPSRPSTQEEVFRSKEGVVLYRNTNAGPRAWIVHEVKTVAQKDLVPTLSEGLDVRSVAVLTDPAPALQTCGGDQAAVPYTHYETDRLELQTTLTCKGMVVVSETWYPGWKAFVDGVPATLYEVDGAIRGVVVDAGTHRIEMRYRPMSVYTGVAMSIAGAALTAWLLFRVRRSLALVAGTA
jgi:hypothetical protein